MSSKWCSLTTLKFVKEYRQQRCLWDSQDKYYKCKDARDAALEEIVQKMNIKGFDRLAAKKKVRTVRSTYWNEKAKIARSTASAKYTYKPKLLWYKLADEFLKVTVTARESVTIHSNVENDECDDTEMFIKEECNKEETNDEANIINKQTIKTLSREIEGNTQENEIQNPKVSNDYEANTEEDTNLGPPRVHKHNDAFADDRSESDLYNTCTMGEVFSRNIANTYDENEFDMFGRIVACNLKKLPQKDALELETEIFHLILARRLK